MSERIPIRFSDRTWNLIDAAATAEGITPASWVRQTVEIRLGVRPPNACPTCGLEACTEFGGRCPHQNSPVDLLQPRSGAQNPRSEGEAIREAMLKWSGSQRP